MTNNQIKKYSWALEVKYCKGNPQYLASAYRQGERKGLTYEIDVNNVDRFGLRKDLEKYS